jgi:hypothetical protein
MEVRNAAEEPGGLLARDAMPALADGLAVRCASAVMQCALQGHSDGPAVKPCAFAVMRCAIEPPACYRERHSARVVPLPQRDALRYSPVAC